MSFRPMPTAPRDGSDLWLLRATGRTTKGSWCHRLGAWLCDDCIDFKALYVGRGCGDADFVGWAAWPPVLEPPAEPAEFLERISRP